MAKKRVLITGANKAHGIGIETLRLFLAAGFEAVVADWEKTGFGRIVNVSSIAAERGNRDVFYGATKAALTNLAKSLYLLDGDKGLIINTVHPGVVTSNWYPENSVRKIIVEEAKKADKLISPEAVAKTIFWLGTENPSSINGEVIRVAA